MSRVRSHPTRKEDRAGDPLDGLVNLFDLGIVLAVAFLVAALQSLHLTTALTSLKHQAPVKKVQSGPSITLNQNQHLKPLEPGERRVKVSSAGKVGTVYRLPNGQLVYVAAGSPPAKGGKSAGSKAGKPSGKHGS